MKLEINTQERKIRLLEEVNIGELFTFLKEILPDLKWKEYSIEGNVVYNVSNPIMPFTPYTPIGPINPTYPTAPNYPWVTYCTSSTGEIK